MAAILLADLVVILHGVFVLHIPAVLWAGFIEATGGICPLTPLENRLRALGGAAAYQGGFIDRYLIPALYPSDLTREIQIVLGIFVILFNMGIYGVCWYRLKQKGS
jgi:hypothetical protein